MTRLCPVARPRLSAVVGRLRKGPEERDELVGRWDKKKMGIGEGAVRCSFPAAAALALLTTDRPGFYLGRAMLRRPLTSCISISSILLMMP